MYLKFKSNSSENPVVINKIIKLEMTLYLNRVKNSHQQIAWTSHCETKTVPTVDIKRRQRDAEYLSR